MASRHRTSAPDRPFDVAWSQPEPAPSRAELACAFSKTLDLAEGREVGHAARVCYIGVSLAHVLGLPPEVQRTVFYAALLHDAGAAPASSELCRILGLREETVFAIKPGRSPQQLAMEVAPTNTLDIVQVLRQHSKLSAEVARDLGLDEAVQEAIAAHHERWDGHGFPGALKGEEIPIAGRLVGAADLVESYISDGLNALAARRNLVSALAEHTGESIDATLAREALALIRSDSFWLGLHDDALDEALPALCPDGVGDERAPGDLAQFVTVFARLADGKGEHTSEHSQRTAQVADQLAEALGFAPARRELVRLAALAHDVGLLGVPARVIAKPDILTLAEMESMRRHPTYSQMVFEALPGLEELAEWVGAHHERPDGKGYPEMLEEDTIPLEARVIALADTYVALTSSRPYRAALSHEDAQQVLLGGAGTQLDPKLVRAFASTPARATSSRTAPRSRQRR